MAGITDLIICGAAGRIGRTLTALARERTDLRVVAAVDTFSAAVGRDVGEVAGVGSIGVPIVTDYGEVVRPSAVTLDFTLAEAALAHLRVAAERQAPIVIGTTGFSPEQQGEIDSLAPRTRALVAANMSVGVTVLMSLVRAAAKALGDTFEPEIVEVHHRLKVDSPSGTALMLARAIADSRGRDLQREGRYGREGIVGKRTDSEIGVMALRGGDVIGDHTVMFLGMGERLELIHRAQSRECLARGALRAAVWLAQQTRTGRYDMADVLGLS